MARAIQCAVKVTRMGEKVQHEYSLTFIYRYDVWMAQGRHDLDLSADVNHVLFVFDLLLTDGLDCNLKINGETQIKDELNHPDGN